jgi:hypothetical protein
VISKGNVIISASLACLALLAIASGQWMTRPPNMDLWGSVVAVGVICAIVAGGPQLLVFAAAFSSIRQGRRPPSAWWTVAYLVFMLQFGAGAAFIVGAIAGEAGLFSTAAAILLVAALVAVASALVVSMVAHTQSGQARDA